MHLLQIQVKTNIATNNSRTSFILYQYLNVFCLLVSDLQLHFIVLLRLKSQVFNLREDIVLAHKEKIMLCAYTLCGQINGQMAPNSSSMHPRILLCIPESNLFFSLSFISPQFEKISAHVDFKST